LAVAALDFACPVVFEFAGAPRFLRPIFSAAGFCALPSAFACGAFRAAAGLFALPLAFGAALFWPGAVFFPRATPFPGTSTPLGAVWPMR
jgi:hypothetical protein